MLIDQITVYKQNHIRIEHEERIIHIDPFRMDSAGERADFILITHDHSDHFSPSDIEKLAGPDTVLVVPEKMIGKAKIFDCKVRRIVSVTPGGSYTEDGLSFETVSAYNIAKPFHPKNAGWVGYVLCLDGKRVYVAGDTDATQEAKQVSCDVALLPIGGTYTMNPKQAAELANQLKPESVIPVHYGSIVGKVSDGEEFEKLVDPSIRVVFKIQFGK